MLRTRLVVVAALAASFLSGACAPKAVRAYVAPTDQTVSVETQMSGDGRGHSVYVTNRSTVPIVVTGIHLYDCENIRNRCEPRKINVRVEPGDRRLVESVRPESPERSNGFRVRFTWTAAGTNPLAEIPPR